MKRQLGLLLTLCCLSACWAQTGPQALSEQWPATAGVDRQVQVTLNGAAQTLLIRSADIHQPILLFLHGGPGFSAMPFSRSLEKQLPENFTLVHWDQRGTGKSFEPGAAPEALTLEQLYADTEALIRWLVARFGQHKVLLVGQSWGSILGLETARRHPELLWGYIGISQIVNAVAGEKLTYAYALKEARQRHNEQALQESRI